MGAEKWAWRMVSGALTKFSEETFPDYVKRSGLPESFDSDQLFHVTTIGNFKSILSEGKISPRYCASMQKNLVYAFYGRPAYRPQIKKDSTVPDEVQPSNDQELVNPLLFPACFVFKSRLISEASALFPFDTGAYFSKRFSRYILTPNEELDRRNKCEAFELGLADDMSKRFVSSFYGTNSNYYMLRPLDTLKDETESDDVKAYHDLIKSDSISAELDDRRGALEVQFSEEIEINSKNVDYVVLPTAIAGQQKYRDFFECRDIAILPYYDGKGKSTDHRTALVSAVFAERQNRGHFSSTIKTISKGSK